MQIIREKQIYTVVDFRGTKESEAAPDRLLPNTAYTLCPAGSENLPDMKEMAELFKQGDFLMTMYGTPSIQYYGDRYKPLFQQLLTLPTDEALLYHCTGGRDRTGMATALFLYALQVPTETIEADFVASNVYLKPQNENMYQPMADAFGADVEKVKEMMMLRPELIRNFFSSIATQYGSIEKFMEAELGIGNQELQTLRNKYTN
jgi:protein-tyrosine phosphatase